MVGVAQGRGWSLRRGLSGWMNRSCVPVMAMAVFAAGALAADRSPARPWVDLSLDSLGVPAISPQFLSAGASMLTVDFVDSSHLLVTFGTRDLVPREPDDPPDDDDRMVAAELVELPSGKILASTKWHMHDHRQYLWRLGKGRFLVRVRNTLFMLTPRALMKTSNPLAPVAFPQQTGIPVVSVLSPDASVVMVESLMTPLPTASEGAKLQTAADSGDSADEDAGQESATPKVLIGFYRIDGGDAPDAAIRIDPAGAVRAPGLLALPLDHDGYLWPGDAKRDSWSLSFNSYGGSSRQVGSVDSSCMPRLQLVSRFEYLALACQGSTDRISLKAFGMDGHETWEEGFGASIGRPVFAFAPEAGRFAMSRIVSAVGDVDPAMVIPDDATQEVRVYQTESGDLLLKASCTPVERNAENFDLSEDGLLAVVVNNHKLQVYKLPEPSKRDRDDLKAAAAFAPPVFDGPVNLARLEAPATGADEEKGSATEPAAGNAGHAPAKTAGAAASAGPSEAGGAAASGDNAGDGGDTEAAPRKPPTLLEPGEHPEFKGAKPPE